MPRKLTRNCWSNKALLSVWQPLERHGRRDTHQRLMRTIKEEEVDLSEYRNFEEAYEQIGQFLEEVYTEKRIHSSLGYLTSMEFENQWNEQQNREKKKQKLKQVVQYKNKKKT
ncbi:IS3 family transposase [Microcoleus sp. FACHB-1515]|uniref:IS3 family transposase n=1 Tax=Cyanophyceae TaxID=3028117 RepID=UPI001F54CD59|nr:IS3 family transposase [Microcoleus sp. FACHB-1515]